MAVSREFIPVTSDLAQVPAAAAPVVALKAPTAGRRQAKVAASDAIARTTERRGTVRLLTPGLWGRPVAGGRGGCMAGHRCTRDSEKRRQNSRPVSEQPGPASGVQS